VTTLRLSAAERKQKRAEAHHLDPVVAIGHDGATPAVRKEIEAALDAHGLVKVRVFSDDRAAREALLAELSEAFGAAPIQHIGKLLVLWRPPAPKEKADKEGRMPGPKVVKVLKFSKSGNHRAQVKKITVLGNMRLAAGGELKRARKRTSSIKKQQG
jgi:RNA-binding protein